MHALTYSAIVRGRTVVASIGDATDLSDDFLVRLLPTRTEQQIVGDRVFSSLARPPLTFVCVSPLSADRRRPLAFLETLCARWTAAYGAASLDAGRHALDIAFVSHFSTLFADYSRPPELPRRTGDGARPAQFGVRARRARDRRRLGAVGIALALLYLLLAWGCGGFQLQRCFE
jgi:hypothetical protein